MKIYRENGPPITQVTLFLEWETLTDMLAGILMIFRGLLENLALQKKFQREGRYKNFVRQGTNTSPTHDVERQTSKGLAQGTMRA